MLVLVFKAGLEVLLEGIFEAAGLGFVFNGDGRGELTSGT